MSINVMAAVWASDVPAPERFTLLALADRADEDGYCWPSIAHLVRKCRSSDRTIRRHLDTLWQIGVLHVDREREQAPNERKAGNRQRTNGYTIRLDALAAYVHETPPVTTGVNLRGVTDCEGYPSQIDRSTPSNLPPDPSVDPPVDPSLSEGTRADAAPGEQADLDLDVEPQQRQRKAGGDPIVAAYVEAYETAHGKRPLGRDIGKVGSASKRLRKSGEVDEHEAVEAARAMGADGRWSDLEREINLRRTGGNPGGARASHGRGPSQASRAAVLELTPEQRAERNYPDLVPGPGTAERPASPPANVAEGRRIAERHGLPFDEYVARFNASQAACRRGDWTTAQQFDDDMRARRENRGA